MSAGGQTLTGAFVTGATGYVGRAVVRQLAAAGLRPVAHVRPDSPRLAEWRSQFGTGGAAVDETPWDEPALAAALAARRPPAVFALLGTTRKRGAATGDTYEGVDYGLTALLLRATGRAARDANAPPPRFVYLSALGANAGSRNPYLSVRGRLEAELAAGDVPFVVARPSFITGPDRDESRPGERVGAAVVDALAAPVRLLGGLVPGRRLADRYRSTTAAELAAALVRLAADPAAAGRVFEGDALRG